MCLNIHIMYNFMEKSVVKITNMLIDVYIMHFSKSDIDRCTFPE